MVILRGVARGEFLGAPHYPLYEIIVLWLHNSGVENALSPKSQLLVFSVTPFKIDQNKNQNRSIEKVQNLGNEMR